MPAALERRPRPRSLRDDPRRADPGAWRDRSVDPEDREDDPVEARDGEHRGDDEDAASRDAGARARDGFLPLRVIRGAAIALRDRAFQLLHLGRLRRDQVRVPAAGWADAGFLIELGLALWAVGVHRDPLGCVDEVALGSDVDLADPTDHWGHTAITRSSHGSGGVGPCGAVRVSATLRTRVSRWSGVRADVRTGPCDARSVACYDARRGRRTRLPEVSGG